jgi:sugar lactone lactonase YvrE
MVETGQRMIRFAKQDSASPGAPRIEAALPDAVLPGGEVELQGAHLGPTDDHSPLAVLGSTLAPVLLSRPSRMIIRVPEGVEGGRLEIRGNGAASNQIRLKIGRLVAENLHPVASPAVDSEGNIYATYSGQRGQKMPVSVYRISPEGDMDAIVTGLVNPTGLALDPEGFLYVSSRHEGTIHRVSPHGAVSLFVEGMGVATGLAFDAEGNLYCGDRSGTVFKIARDRQIFVFATLEPSVAAYHLAFGPDGVLYVTGPTTSSNDCVYAIDRDGAIRVYYRGLGRPQGMAIDVSGALYVAASWRGKRGVVRLASTPQGAPSQAELAIAGGGIVGLAFAPGGSAIVATHNAVYDVALGVEGLRLF